MNQTSRVLHTAADLIDLYGFAKFTGCDNEGRLCAVGALVRAAGDSEQFLEAHSVLARVVCGEGWKSVCEWNDHEHTTHEEVVSWLNTAALVASVMRDKW